MFSFFSLACRSCLVSFAVVLSELEGFEKQEESKNMEIIIRDIILQSFFV